VIFAIANLIIISSTNEMWFEKTLYNRKSWVRCWDGFVAGTALVLGWHCGWRSWTWIPFRLCQCSFDLRITASKGFFSVLKGLVGLIRFWRQWKQTCWLAKNLREN